MKLLFRRYYAPALTRTPVKLLVFAVFLGYAILSGLATGKLKVGQPIAELAPDDSYLQDYVRVVEVGGRC